MQPEKLIQSVILRIKKMKNPIKTRLYYFLFSLLQSLEFLLLFTLKIYLVARSIQVLAVFKIAMHHQ